MQWSVIDGIGDMRYDERWAMGHGVFGWLDDGPYSMGYGGRRAMGDRLSVQWLRSG